MTTPVSRTERYDELLGLADLLDETGREMRARAPLGERVLGDADVAESAELAPTTFEQLDHDVRAATTGQQGLLARSIELDADALAVRATVLTYRWIDDLRAAASRTLGAIAGRAVGYLAPDVALGGAVVSAGLIETDALDREEVTAYLDELIAENPELLDHVAGNDGLLDGLPLRSLLTTAEPSAPAVRAGLRDVGAEPFAAALGPALRDVAGPLVTEAAEPRATTDGVGPFSGVGDLMAALATSTAVSVREVGPARWVAFLPGPYAGIGRLRLVVGDRTTYAAAATSTIAEVVGPDAHVLLVGSGQGGSAAVEVAGRADLPFTVDHVVTAGAPAALVPRVPPGVRVLSLEDRSDPVALLGSLVNAAADDRLTVVVDTSGAVGGAAYVTAGRAVDASDHSELRAEVGRLHELGYLT
ncbi:MAG: hypothetical protein H6529_02830 [Nocardioides sp.]|nr:hypothetical protein [Nocardioides sp.]